MKTHLNALTCIAIMILIMMSKAHAEFLDLERVQSEVSHWVETEAHSEGQLNDFEVEVKRVDSRLKLSDCLQDLAIQLSSGSFNQKRVVVAVSCPTQSWQLRVNVMIKQYAHVVTALYPFKKGDKLTADKLGSVRADITGQSRYFSDPNELNDHLANQAIVPGSIIKTNMIKAETLVKRGDRVSMRIKLPGLDITSVGIAQNDGTKGDIISLKNSHSNKMVDAKITGSMQAEVLL